MTAQATTKLQVNYKLADGTLINVYGDNEADLAAQLVSLGNQAKLIADVSKAFGASQAVATVQATLGATVVSSDVATPSANIPEGHCKHGALTWRESKPGAPKAWKGWFCPSPKGTADQCAPKFVK
jgi:hypothetical protein